MDTVTTDSVKRRLLQDCTRLERRLERYQAGGFSLLEMAKFAVYAGYTLVRAVEPMEDVPDEVKHQAIAELVPALYHKYDPDIPGIPAFIEQMLEPVVLGMVVSALSQVLLREHYRAPAP
jgi:hypothetical protein